MFHLPNDIRINFDVNNVQEKYLNFQKTVGASAGLVNNIILKKLKSSSNTTSLTPIITVSKKHLCQYGLWENTIRLSGMKREKAMLHYYGEAEIGDNIPSFRVSQFVNVKLLKLGVIIMLGLVKEWHAIEDIPEHVIPISMSGNWQQDEYVILMIASNKRKEVTHDALWTRDFVSGIQNVFRISLQGNGHKHHGSYGNYFGWGITAKYEIEDCISYGKFATKQGIDDKLHKEYCTVLQSDITFAAIELNSHLPWIVQCGQQVIQSLVNISNNMCLPSAKMTSFQEGMVSAYICQNAWCLLDCFFFIRNIIHIAILQGHT